MNIREVLIDTFSNSKIPEDIDNLAMGDFEEWDSIGNFNLILAIEEKYGVQFEIEQIENLNSVKKISEAIVDALSLK